MAYAERRLHEHLRREIAALELAPGSTVLDYGCGDSPYRDSFPTAEYIRADLPHNPAADLHLERDGRIPLPPGQVDLVLSTQVLEHAVDPSLYLAEVRRVLKPGGRLLLTTHGMMYYHPDPEDYWRWTPSGLELIARRAELTVRRTRGLVGLTATCLQLGQEPLLYRLPRPLQPLLAAAVYQLSRLADRLEPATVRDNNALVFSVLAEAPS